MRVLMLCEGKTDAILVSYLLCKLSGWIPIKSNKKEKVKVLTEEKKNESAYWYERGEDRLLICGVGGKDKFSDFFADKLSDVILNYPPQDSFDKLVVIHDKDTDTINDIENKIKASLAPIASFVQNNQWVSNDFTDAFGKEIKIDILGLIIPFENEGALESVMLDSLKEKSPEREIVESSERFVDEVKNIAKEFINIPRMELKAKLGVTFAVLSPMKVFTYIDELIKTVNWEEYDSIREVFSKILEL